MHTVDRQTCSPPAGRGWLFLSIGLIWLWTGIRRTIWQPGLGSVTSWMGRAATLASGLGVVAALFALRSWLPADRARRKRVVVFTLAVALAAMVAWTVLAFALPRLARRDFYFDSIYTLIGAVNIFMGLDAVLEKPREQNIGWLYLMAGLAVLMWGSTLSLIPLVGTGFPVLWTSISVVLVAGFYLVAVTLILHYPSAAKRGQRAGCGALITSMAYGATGMFMLSFYLCALVMSFMLPFTLTPPDIKRFLLFTAWTLLGAGAIWLGVCRLRGWDWV